MDPGVVDQSNERDPSDEVDQDREYGCKYCQKKFTNKQALGGHQNAHKLERAVEKNAREIQENHFGYFGGGLAYRGMPVTPPPPFFGSYNRTHDYLNKTMYRAFLPPHIPMQQDIHNHFRYNSPSRLLPGSSNVYPGRMPPTPFPRHASAPSPPYVVPNNARFFALESARPNVVVSQPSPENDRSVEDSGIDLTLKL